MALAGCPAGRAAFAATLLVLCVTHPVFAETGFSFRVPDGWVDAASATPEVLATVPAEIFVDAQSGKYAALAVDAAHAGDGFGENLKAVVRPGSHAMSDSVLDETVAAMRKTEGTTVGEYRVVAIGGVDVGRVVADKNVAGRQTRTLVYFLPGNGEHAVLTYEATPETFAEYRPIFEAAAAATGGVRHVASREAPSPQRRIGIVLGAAVAVLGAAAVGLAVRRGKRRAQAEGGAAALKPPR